ncbi:MAG: co-chaperone GroES [Chloroflexi bacterium]|nr:MAG: co-chaperone GroES [Chloroflexota bacterium]HHH40703.1 co-chaperone GroES [Chloroflexota bacterium]
MKIEPLGARVLIRPLDQETVTESGIYIPETAKEKPQQGIVEAVGDEEEMSTNLAVGDKVIFPKYTGTEIKIGGVEYLLMDESDVLARIVED